jgi:hypothetical protein
MGLLSLDAQACSAPPLKSYPYSLLPVCRAAHRQCNIFYYWQGVGIEASFSLHLHLPPRQMRTPRDWPFLWQVERQDKKRCTAVCLMTYGAQHPGMLVSDRMDNSVQLIIYGTVPLCWRTRLSALGP